MVNQTAVQVTSNGSLSAVDRVVILLTSLGDALPAPRTAAFDPFGPQGEPGSAYLSMGELWYRGSYGELCRRLSELREAERRLHRGVSGRYLEAEQRVMILPVRRSRWGARVLLPERTELVGGLAMTTGDRARVLVRRWRSDVDEMAAGEGVRRLAVTMHGGNTRRIHVPFELI